MLGHKAYMQVEIELTPVSAMHETLELAQIVDQFGAERLGISDVVLFRDVYTTTVSYTHLTLPTNREV